jgi:hypothetical protein
METPPGGFGLLHVFTGHYMIFFYLLLISSRSEFSFITSYNSAFTFTIQSFIIVITTHQPRTKNS